MGNAGDALSKPLQVKEKEPLVIYTPWSSQQILSEISAQITVHKRKNFLGLKKMKYGSTEP